MRNRNGRHYLETMVAISMMLSGGRIRIRMAAVTPIVTVIDHKIGATRTGMGMAHRVVGHDPHIRLRVTEIQGDLMEMHGRTRENNHHHH